MYISKCVFFVSTIVLSVKCSSEKNPSDMKLNLPPEPEYTWIVKGGDEDTESAACMLGAGDIRIQRITESGTIDSEEVDEVPQASVDVEGRCGQDEAELKLTWQDEDGEENELNLVVERRGRLAALTGAFLNIPHGSKSRSAMSQDTMDLTATMDIRDYATLQWPLRYGLHCQKELTFALYPSQTNPKDPKHGEVKPAAYLRLENLRLEVFRRETLEDQYPEELFGDFFTLRTWACEFHVIYDWAPIMVGAGLAFLIVVMVGAFMIKQYVKKSKNKYNEIM